MGKLMECAAPGETFEAQDGNYNRVTDARVSEEHVPVSEWYLLDPNGAEIRAGNFVRVVGRDDWKGRICLVRGVTRGAIYGLNRGETGPSCSRIPDAWSPSVGSVQVTYLGYLQTGFAPLLVERVDLADEEHDRLLLAEALRRDAGIAERASKVEAERTTLAVEIRTLRERLGEV